MFVDVTGAIPIFPPEIVTHREETIYSTVPS